MIRTASWLALILMACGCFSLPQGTRPLDANPGVKVDGKVKRPTDAKLPDIQSGKDILGKDVLAEDVIKTDITKADMVYSDIVEVDGVSVDGTKVDGRPLDAVKFDRVVIDRVKIDAAH